MKKKRNRTATGLWILCVAAIALAAGYFLGKERGVDDRRPPAGREATPSKGAGPKVEAQIPTRGEEGALKDAPEGKGEPEGRAECARVQEEVHDFFQYLDKKSYVRNIEEGLDTRAWFRRILAKLSTQPPSPAGEGLDSVLLASNAFHLFRHLEGKEIRLLREILGNEATTLETNLELFFRWFTLGDRCPDPGVGRPSPEMMYTYAAFFLNTLGGQAYLFRREGTIRVLVSYYSLLILHEAEQKGRNRYGLDLSPLVTSLVGEMSRHGELLRQKEYLRRLAELRGVYPIRR
jgi:hypothetical protein